MNKEDIGIIMVIATLVIPLAYVAYLCTAGQLAFGSYEVVSELGKNPIIFLVDVILFLLGTTLIITSIEEDKAAKFIGYLYIIPVFNVVVAAVYSIGAAGFPSGLGVFIDAMFISMYNFIVLLSLFLIDLRSKGIGMEVFKKERGTLILIAEFLVYLVLRIQMGPSFPLMAFFMALAIATSFIFYSNFNNNNK